MTLTEILQRSPAFAPLTALECQMLERQPPLITTRGGRAAGIDTGEYWTAFSKICLPTNCNASFTLARSKPG